MDCAFEFILKQNEINPIAQIQIELDFNAFKEIIIAIFWLQKVRQFNGQLF